MTFLRPAIFWCHLVAGVLAGLVILIMSATGVLLTYERQMTWWADTRHFAIAPDGHRQPPSALLAAVAAARPDLTPTAITVRAAAGAPATVTAGRTTLFVDPYTGQVLGEGSGQRMRAFFRTMTDWHRWLGAQAASRPFGRSITGASNLLFLFVVVSGLYLWVPRVWTRAQFRQVLWFRRGLSPKARDFNWHHVIGFWSWVPLFIVVITAVPISYPWASALVYRLAGDQPPAATTGRAAPAGPVATTPSLGGVDALWARAEIQAPGWRSLSMRVPTSESDAVAFTIDHGDGGQPQRRATLTLARETGDMVSWEPFAALSPGRRLRALVRFTHTGETLGIAGQTVAGLVSLGSVVLVYTGIALSLRRFLAWRAARVLRARQPLPAAGRKQAADQPAAVTTAR